MIFRKSTFLAFFVIFISVFSTIQNISAQFAPVEFNVSSGMGIKGSKVCLDVTSKNFISVQSFQFNISYNSQVVLPDCPPTYVNPLLSTSTLGNIFSCDKKTNGYINIVWADNPISIPEGEILFTFCFDLIGEPGSKSPVFFNGAIIDVEINQAGSDGKDKITDVIVSNGGTIMITSPTLTAVVKTCDADGINNTTQGVISFYATSGTGPYSYVINNKNTGAVVYSGNLAGDGISQTIKDVPQGFYTITITDATGFMYTTPTISISNNQLLAYDPPIVQNPKCISSNGGKILIKNLGGGQPPYTYQWSNLVSGVGLDSLTSLTSGTYYLTVSDVTGCFILDTFTLSLDTLKMNVMIKDTASCLGAKDGSIILTTSGGTTFPNNVYRYRINESSWVNFTSPITIPNISAGTFKVGVLDSVNCSIRDLEFNMPYKTGIMASISKLENIKCFGDPNQNGRVEITASPSGSYTFVSVTGFPSVIGGVLGGNLFISDPLGKGDYAIRVRSSIGCLDTVKFSIVEPTPVVIVDNVIQPDCAKKGSISLSASGGTGTNYTYDWIPVQSTNTNTISDLNGGQYFATVTDENGCTATYSKSLISSGTMNISVDVTNVSCGGNKDGKATVNVTFTGGNQMFVITWKDANGVAYPIKTSTLSNLGAGDYSVEVVAADGCSVTSNFRINESGNIGYTSNVENAKCYNDLGKIEITPETASGQVYTFSWVKKGTTTPILSTANILNATGGEYTVSIMTSGGCQKDTSFIITSPIEILVPEPLTRNVTCAGLANGQGIIMNGPVGITYTWSSGTVANFAVDLEAGQNWVVGTDANLCHSDTLFFNVGTFPALKVDDLNSILINPSCFGDKTGSIDITATGGTGISYSYSWPDLSINGNTLSNLAAGGYVLHITDSNNCLTKDTIYLTQPDELQAFVDRNLSLDLDCNNQTQGKIALYTIGGNAGKKTYTWQSGVETENDIAINLTPGTYCATISDNKGCKDTICQTLVAPQPLIGKVNTPSEPICNGGTTCISVDYITGGTGNKYTFQINNGTRYPIDSCVTVNAGTYFINLIDSAGCSIDTIISILQPDPIHVDLGDDQEVQLGMPSTTVNAIIDSPVTLDTLIWNPIDFLTCLTENCQTVSLEPATTTTYKLTVIDQNGCTGDDEITITVKAIRNVYFANIFTPNRDGNNDFFQVVTGLGVEKVVLFNIYDRWGNLVYAKENYEPDPTGSDGWDGRYQGLPLDPGVFVYYAKVQFIDDKIIEYSGSVTLADKVKN